MNKNLANIEGNMLGNFNFTPQLGTIVLAYSQVVDLLCSE
jgi:hypothetical protein